METTALRPPGRGRDLWRRLARRGATVAAMAAIGLGLTAVPALAMPHDPCATARATFRSHMNQALFWIGAADQLAAGGNTTSANLATNEAYYYLDLADAALDDISGAC